MASHVHIVILTKFPVAKIMQILEGATACRANRLLGCSGAFSAIESYDHWMRSAEELDCVIGYVVRNPVKAASSTILKTGTGQALTL
jgi:hypothetical protein